MENKLYRDIIEAPHTLIAGTTGSGKSNVMNGIIRQIMTDYSPAQAEMIMIDPKVIELIDYRSTAFCTAFETEFENVPALLDEVIETMETRYHRMAEEHTKQYKGKKIFVIIDELADLLISPKAKEITLKLQKMLQKGRAADIHIIAATQAPNRQIIPANLVLNFTNRLALRCMAAIESRQIINIAGAELLPQYGKGLYLSPRGIVTVSIPLTPDNADIIARWKREKPIVRHEEPIEINIQTGLYRQPRYVSAPQDSGKGIAAMGWGLIIAGLAIAILF